MAKLSSVVIVGRMNVGKSTLFNRLSVDARSIVLDFKGVTRDFIKDEVCWKDRFFELIDTGGIGFKKTDDVIVERVRARAISLLEAADIVLLVVDGKAGVMPEDREISSLLHKLNKKVFLVINKVDNESVIQESYEFEALGHKVVFPITALHGKGVDVLLDEIVAQLPKKGTDNEEKPEYKVVLLGKPNVGKSSLMNLLLKEERSIVTDIPGTTREAISEKISFYQEDLLLTDTPGIRRKKNVDTDLETLMVKSSLFAMEDANIVLLLIDSSEGKLSDQELKLAFYAFSQKYKALMILFNKADLITTESEKALKDSASEYQYLLKKVPQLTISCKSGKNVGKILSAVKELWLRYSQLLPNAELKLLFKEALRKKPLMHKESPLIVYEARQLKQSPITILLIVNEPKWFGESQLGFFDRLMRDKFDLKGVPVKFLVRKGA
jgi:GTP-binding protein